MNPTPTSAGIIKTVDLPPHASAAPASTVEAAPPTASAIAPAIAPATGASIAPTEAVGGAQKKPKKRRDESSSDSSAFSSEADSDEEEEDSEDGMEEDEEDDEVDVTEEEILSNDPLYFVLSKVFMTKDGHKNVADLLQELLAQLKTMSSRMGWA